MEKRPTSAQTRPTPRLALAIASAAAIALGLLWTTQAVARVETLREVHVADRWTESGDFSYANMDAPGHLTTVEPTLDITFNWTLDDPRAKAATAAGTLTLQIEGTLDGRAWTLRPTLANATLAPGERTITMTGRIDFAAIDALIANATTTTRGNGAGAGASNASWTILAHVEHATTPAEVADAGAPSDFSLPIRYDAPLYTLPPASDAHATHEHATRTTRTHVERAGVGALRSAPGAPALALVGIGGLALAWRLEAAL